MPSNHLILCHPLLLLPSVFPSSSSHQVPKYWSFSFSSSPSNEYSGLISFRIDWFDLLAVQGMLMSLLQHHGSKTSVLMPSVFFTVELSPCQWCTEKMLGIFTGNIFLVCDELLKVEELAVPVCANFIHDCEFQVCKTALGTSLPALVSLKKMMKESSPPQWSCHLASCHPTGSHVPGSSAPSQQSSQPTMLIWTPSWPAWMKMH